MAAITDLNIDLNEWNPPRLDIGIIHFSKLPAIDGTGESHSRVIRKSGGYYGDIYKLFAG